MEEDLQEFVDPAILKLLFPEIETEENVRIACTDPDGPSTSSEFKETTEKELKYLQDLNNNSNTVLSTTNWVRRFNKWAAERGVPTDMKLIAKADLDVILQRFYAELVKRNGENYEPESLKVMLTSLNRHIQENCGFSVIKNKEFALSLRVLNGKAISLQQAGKGKRPNRADPITEQEEEVLWNTVLGQDNPTSLNNTIFYLLGQHFGTRGCQEHHQVRIEELKFTREPGIGEITKVEWMEGPTKTRQGGLNKLPRMVSQKLYIIGGNKCPVACLEKLISKRPVDLSATGPLYLSPLRKERDWCRTPIWFSQVPLGVNSINTIMKNMSQTAGLDTTNKHFTNHSVRKTTVQKLKKAGVAATDIMAITGHKSQQSLADYGELDECDHRRIGEILSTANKSSEIELSSKIPPKVEPLTSITPLATSSYASGPKIPPQVEKLASTTSSATSSYGSGAYAPVFNFNNSTVFIFDSSKPTSNTSIQQYTKVP